MISSTEEKLKSHLMSKGMQPLPIDESLETRPNLSFQEGDGSKVFVKIPSREELENRNAILSLILNSTSFRQTANKVYLALPKIYASTIDGAIIQGQGLGLIVYDEKTIDEVIAPKIFEHQASRSQENHAEEIEQLVSRLRQLEQTVQTLKSEISQLKTIRPTFDEAAKTEKIESAPDSLPSFFRDNAWLDILSKRGREPERYVS
jgi:hypothetical protein